MPYPVLVPIFMGPPCIAISIWTVHIFHYLSGSHTTTNHHPGSSSSPATDSGHTTSHASPTGPGQPTESATDSRSPGGCHATDPGGSADTGAHAATDSDAVAADGTTNSTGKMNWNKEQFQIYPIKWNSNYLKCMNANYLILTRFTYAPLLVLFCGFRNIADPKFLSMEN